MPEPAKPPRTPRRRLRAALRIAALAVVLLVGLPYLDVFPAPRHVARPLPAATDRYSFVVIGDTQQMPPVDWIVSGGSKKRSRVRDEIRRLQPQFTVLAGDVVGEGFYKPFWRKFRREYAGLPIWPVLGNHDLHGPNGLDLGYYFETFPHVGWRRWYAVRQPPLAFLMLDSNLGEMSAEEGERQTEWLGRELDRAEADPEVRGVVLVTHHPPFSTNFGGGSEAVRTRFWDAAAKRSKFLAFFSGHHHAYQRIQVGPRAAFVSGGGGAPLWLWGNARLPAGARLACARRSHHLLHARVEDAGLRVTMRELQPDGRWIARDEAFLPWPARH